MKEKTEFEKRLEEKARNELKDLGDRFVKAARSFAKQSCDKCKGTGIFKDIISQREDFCREPGCAYEGIMKTVPKCSRCGGVFLPEVEALVCPACNKTYCAGCMTSLGICKQCAGEN